MTEKVPVFIPVRDRVTPLRLVVDWLERAGHEEIWLIDNASTYEPLLDFLRHSSHHVIHLEHNFGHRSPWLSGAVQRHARGRHFIVTDPDVLPDDDCPLDAAQRFRELLDRYPDLHKAGFGLRIDDLPEHYAHSDEVRSWERRFWTEELEPGVYRADIDTTFALYRPMRRHLESHAVRTGFPVVARHLPWYLDSSNLSEEDLYYREHADPIISNWDQPRLPLWKQRWLAEHRSDG